MCIVLFVHLVILLKIFVYLNNFLNNSQNLSSKVSMGQVKSNTCFSTHILHRNHYLRVNAHHWVFFTKL